MQQGFGLVESKDAQLQNIRSELRDLITVDSRIRQCQQMSREIEEFEQRVQKVEEFIRNDELVMLSNLVVYQLSASMNVVRGMNKAKSAGNTKLKNPDPNSQVFRQHQQSRLQRFDKLILTYVQYKQNEILINDASKLTGNQKDMDPEQTYKLNTLEINSILHLFNIFNKEQYL